MHATLQKVGGVRPRLFGPRFKKRGPKQPKAPFYTRGLSKKMSCFHQYKLGSTFPNGNICLNRAFKMCTICLGGVASKSCTPFCLLIHACMHT